MYLSEVLRASNSWADACGFGSFLGGSQRMFFSLGNDGCLYLFSRPGKHTKFTMDFNGILMGFHGISWDFNGISWDFNGISW